MLQFIEGQVELLVSGAPLSNANPIPVTFSAVADQGVHLSSGAGSAIGTPLFSQVTNFPATQAATQSGTWTVSIGSAGLGTNANPLVVSGTTFTPPADQGMHIASGAGFASATPLFTSVTNFPATMGIANTGLGVAGSPLIVNDTSRPSDAGVHLASGAGTTAGNPLFVVTPDTTVTGTINTVDATGGTTGNPTAGSFVSVTLPNSSTSFSIEVSGAWLGTLQIEISDDGTTWYSLATRAAGGASDIVNNIQANGIFRGDVAAERYVRCRASAWTSGAATIVIVTSAGGFAVTITGQLPGGNNNLGYVKFDQATPGTTNGVVVNTTAGANAMGAPVTAGDSVLYLLRKDLDQAKTLVATSPYPLDTGNFNETPPFTNQWVRKVTLAVPAGLYAVPLSLFYNSSVGGYVARAAEQVNMGRYTTPANTFAAGFVGSAATYDGYADLDLECNIAFAGGALAATFTITYTNQVGASKTTSVTVAARMTVGQRINAPLAAGDTFATAVTNITCNVATFTAGQVQVTGSRTLVAAGISLAGCGIEVETRRRKNAKPGRNIVLEYNASAATNAQMQISCPVELTADV